MVPQGGREGGRERGRSASRPEQRPRAERERRWSLTSAAPRPWHRRPALPDPLGMLLGRQFTPFLFILFIFLTFLRDFHLVFCFSSPVYQSFVFPVARVVYLRL